MSSSHTKLTVTVPYKLLKSTGSAITHYINKSEALDFSEDFSKDGT